MLGVIALDRKSDYEDVRDDPNVDYGTKAELHENAVRMSDMATIAAVAATAAGITTGVLFFTRPQSGNARAPRFQARLTPTGVLVNGEF